MTESSESTLFEGYASTPEGARELAAVDLADQAATLIRQALEASPIDQRTLASMLGVTESRVSQVVNGDGNLRVAAIAKYLRALGYVTRLLAEPIEEGLPRLPRKPSTRPRRSIAPTTPSAEQGIANLPYLRLFDANPLPPMQGIGGSLDSGQLSVDEGQAGGLFFELPAEPQ